MWLIWYLVLVFGEVSVCECLTESKTGCVIAPLSPHNFSPGRQFIVSMDHTRTNNSHRYFLDIASEVGRGIGQNNVLQDINFYWFRRSWKKLFNKSFFFSFLDQDHISFIILLYINPLKWPLNTNPTSFRDTLYFYTIKLSKESSWWQLFSRNMWLQNHETIKLNMIFFSFWRKTKTK